MQSLNANSNLQLMRHAISDGVLHSLFQSCWCEAPIRVAISEIEKEHLAHTVED